MPNSGHTERPVVRVVPGTLPKKAAVEKWLMFRKVCIDCGTSLDTWGNYADRYHSPSCKYSSINRNTEND